MKIYQKPIRILSLEKDDERNITKMQLRVWFLNNNTTVVVRLLKHNKNASNILWNGIRTNGEVDNLIIKFLESSGIIQESTNWIYSVDMVNDFQEQDSFEEKQDCVYFAFQVKKSLLNF